MGELDLEKKVYQPTAGEMSAAPVDHYVEIDDAAEKEASDYYYHLELCINKHITRAVFKDLPHFYVCVQFKNEKLLTALGKPTMRRKFIGLIDCPKPNYQMNLYKYHKDLDAIEEIWLMSNKPTCKYLVEHKNNISMGERRLLDYYLAYKRGDLFRLMKKLNNEKEDTPELVNRRKD
jgi:hypothetical protein